MSTKLLPPRSFSYLELEALAAREGGEVRSLVPGSRLSYVEWRDSQGRLHRDGDLPARIALVGTREWWVEDQRHRGGDLPAVVHADGSMEWYWRGKRHRGGGKPAVIWSDGQTQYYVHGERVE